MCSALPTSEKGEKKARKANKTNNIKEAVRYWFSFQLSSPAGPTRCGGGGRSNIGSGSSSISMNDTRAESKMSQSRIQINPLLFGSQHHLSFLSAVVVVRTVKLPGAIISSSNPALSRLVFLLLFFYLILFLLLCTITTIETI